jgi:ABC-type Fe3+/spermidine/putrescine transport system ATPase subunit
VIRTEDLCYKVGDFRLHDVSLEVTEGEYFVLLGPPGAGKSIFLECLCGLNRAESGRVLIDGTDVTGLEPRSRPMGYVPQDYALFPHLSVASNIGFGLVSHGAPRAERTRRIGEIAGMLGIGHLLGRSIGGLSGGEKQRTALARALVIRPRVLLLDEPVSALDESTRERVCAELRRIHSEFNVATIHVSHNLEEAFTVADRGGILSEGRFLQIGPMGELLRAPRTEFVARFMRCENLLEGRAAGVGAQADMTAVELAGARLDVPGKHEGDVKFVVRPEDLELVRPDAPCPPGSSALPVRLTRTVDRGAHVRAEVAASVPLVVYLSPGAFRGLGAAPGDQLRLLVRSEAIQVLAK